MERRWVKSRNSRAEDEITLVLWAALANMVQQGLLMVLINSIEEFLLKAQYEFSLALPSDGNRQSLQRKPQRRPK